MSIPFRLIALDMDGTLLDGQGQFPPGFDELLRTAHQRGIVLAPASGRQLRTLQSMFETLDGAPDGFIAENGAIVALSGKVISTTPMPMAPVREIIDAVGDLGVGSATVVCHPEVAYIPTGLSGHALAEVAKYYYATKEVDNLRSHVEGAVKVAVYAPVNAEKEVYPTVRQAGSDLNVVISGAHWVDIMDPAANKGVALRALAQEMGIAREETAAFGDYLNDYALLEAAGTAWAMENAHPDLKAIADHIAPANTDYGVVTVLRELFGT